MIELVDVDPEVILCFSEKYMKENKNVVRRKLHWLSPNDKNFQNGRVLEIFLRISTHIV